MRTLVPGLLDAWLRSTDDGVIGVGADGRVVLHNAAASRVTGHAPDAAMGRNWREVLRLDSAHADALWAARGDGAVQIVSEILCAQGNLRAAEVAATGWREAQGGSALLIRIRDLAVLCRQRSATGGRSGYGALVGHHPSMLALFDLIEAVAPSDAPVLIEGETGTGKELVAQALHARSRRAERPLIVVNCAVQDPATLEAELFGRGRGRTASAAPAVIGRAELAHTGTLLLDGIASLSATAQGRLLRLLEAGELQRLGENAVRRIDVRILAATAQSLEHQIAGGKFRAELFFRLRLVRLAIPPLRERRSDVPRIAEALVARLGRSDVAISPAAANILEAAPWQGNVRELESILREAISQLPTEPANHVIGPEHLPENLWRDAPPLVESASLTSHDRRSQLLRALSAHGGNRAAAARSLGIGRATFYRWLRESGLAGESAPAARRDR